MINHLWDISGGFQTSSCFYGTIGGVEWWSYAKTHADIIAMGCLDRGDLWSMTKDTLKVVGDFEGAFDLAVCCRGKL